MDVIQTSILFFFRFTTPTSFFTSLQLLLNSTRLLLSTAVLEAAAAFVEAASLHFRFTLAWSTPALLIPVLLAVLLKMPARLATPFEAEPTTPEAIVDAVTPDIVVAVEAPYFSFKALTALRDLVNWFLMFCRHQEVRWDDVKVVFVYWCNIMAVYSHFTDLS